MDSGGDPRLLILSFIQSTSTRRLSYRDLHHELHMEFSANPNFKSGQILDTLERGVAHPVLHMKEVNAGLFSGDELVKPEITNQLVTIRRGLYKEIHHIIPDSGWMSEEETNKQPGSSGYILLGFKRFEGSIIDTTWRDWSGARYIYLHLDDMFQARRIALLQRVEPSNNIDLFNYVLLVECASISDENIPALIDFVQRLRVHKVGAYVAAYERTTDTVLKQA